MSGIRLAVERTRPGYGDVLFIEGINERRVVHQLRALESRVDKRKILLWIRGEFHNGAIRQKQIHAALEPYGASVRDTGRHDNASSSRDTACRDRFIQGAEARCLEVPVRKRGFFNSGQNRFSLVPRISLIDL